MPAPSVPFDASRTKIVATVGPACAGEAALAELIWAGVDVFRLNLAHGSPAEHEALLAAIRRAADAVGKPVGVLADLSGPKIRLGRLFADPTDCRLGEEFAFVRGDAPAGPHELTCSYPLLVDELAPGDVVMLADGVVGMRVVERRPDRVRCEVTAAGRIRTRQGVNLPGARLSTPALTAEDRVHARWAAARELDFVGLSFVRRPEDVRELQALLREAGSSALVVAKIEKREALDCLEEIAAAADALMVARGDLGVEIDIAETPAAQKRIIAIARRLAKPVIVATQMLDSMQRSRLPTRAEVSDVANAILDGADACMLSGETAVGEFPVEAVAMMRRIALSAETQLAPPSDAPLDGAGVPPVTAEMSRAAGRLADRLGARLVAVATRSGATARLLSKHRHRTPTVGLSGDPRVLRRMCLYWGVTPLPGGPLDDPPAWRRYVEEWARAAGVLTPGDRIVFLAGHGLDPQAHNALVVDELPPA